jgi:uncharacterized peroxidase-related enzyme
MPHILPLQNDAAPPDIAALYLDFQRRMGFPAPPNFIKTQGHSAAAAQGTWGLVQNVLVGGVLPRTLKEMIFVVISHDRRCQYCESAHIACCRMLGVDRESIDALIDRLDELAPRRTRDIVQFAVRCARDPQGLTEADYALLRGHGLSEGEVVEVISMSALAVYANILADATGMEPDDMFGWL